MLRIKGTAKEEGTNSLKADGPLDALGKQHGPGEEPHLRTSGAPGRATPVPSAEPGGCARGGHHGPPGGSQGAARAARRPIPGPPFTRLST